VEYDRDGLTIPVGEIRQGETLADIAPLGIARTYRFRTSGPQAKTNLQIVKIESRAINVTAELQRKFVIPELDMEFIWVEKLPGYVGRTEVTQSQYQKVTRKNPSQHPGNMNPVDSVSWTNAWEFCQLLSQHKPAESGFKYTLPTRSQWLAFAADATTNRALAVISFGMTRATTEPVASKSPNQHGLYDVCGNVWEWTAEKLLMGSSFTKAMYSVSQSVSGNPDDVHQEDVGFRVILIAVPGLAKNP
jgi:formylglycine-generating enzyme required for sulfatase activity